jgi:hypothetical protein
LAFRWRNGPDRGRVATVGRSPQRDANAVPIAGQTVRANLSDMHSSLRRLLDRPGGLLALSLLIALVVGLLTSSLLGFGLFLIVPSVVARLFRRY